MSEEVFGEYAGDKDDKSGDRVVNIAGGEEFFDGFDDDMNVDGDDDESDDDSGGALDFGAVGGEFVMTGEFFADNDEETRDGVDKTMQRIGDDSDRV